MRAARRFCGSHRDEAWYQPLYRDQQVATLPAFIPLKVESKRVAEAPAIIELPLGQQMLTVKWPISDPEGCARFIRGLTQ